MGSGTGSCFYCGSLRKLSDHIQIVQYSYRTGSGFGTGGVRRIPAYRRPHRLNAGRCGAYGMKEEKNMSKRTRMLRNESEQMSEKISKDGILSVFQQGYDFSLIG